MTGDLFTNWLKKLDNKFHIQKRKIAMVLDNCSAHPHVTGLKAIKLFFLPPNTTSVTQPMDQGIINSFKVHYTHLLITRVAVEKKEKLSWNILDAMQASRDAWNKVTHATIVNCFRHCGFLARQLTEEAYDEEDELPLARLVLIQKIKESGFPIDEEELHLYHILTVTLPLMRS